MPWSSKSRGRHSNLYDVEAKVLFTPPLIIYRPFNPISPKTSNPILSLARTKPLLSSSRPRQTIFSSPTSIPPCQVSVPSPSRSLQPIPSSTPLPSPSPQPVSPSASTAYILHAPSLVLGDFPRRALRPSGSHSRAET